MSSDQRRHPRYGVHLAVRYTNAEQFVTDYLENLSVGGLFIAGADSLPMFTETAVEVELPGQGTWTVRAKSVFLIDREAAQRMGRTAGAGFQIIDKPPGFDDALLGYLLRLGRRRDFKVMCGEVIGRHQLVDSGYVVVPLVQDAALAEALADDKLLAVVVPPDLVELYRGYGAGERVRTAAEPRAMADLIAKLDALIE
jgi:hypothetical protein